MQLQTNRCGSWGLKAAIYTLAVWGWIGMMGKSVWAAHPGPTLEMSLEDGNVVVGWNNEFSFLDEDPPFGRTFDFRNARTGSPAIRFSAQLPSDVAYSFQVMTPLYFWNHLDSDPNWGATAGGPYIEIWDGTDVVAVVTDGVSANSPASVPVSESYVGGRKITPLGELDDHLHTFVLFTPQHQSDPIPGGDLGAYGFGMQLRMWQEDQAGQMIEDYGYSDPFFISFRNRPTLVPAPDNWMSPQQFAMAISAGQALVPEPSSGMAFMIGALMICGARDRVRDRSCA